MLENIKKWSMVLGTVMLLASCSNDMEDVNPSSTLGAVSADAAKVASTNSFGFSALRTSDKGYTWSFDVTRIGDKIGANANTVMLALYGCDNEMLILSDANVAAITVLKAGGSVQTLAPTYIESSAKACSMASTPGYVRFAEFEGNVKDGSIYTFTVKLKTPVQLTKGTIGVKAGNECIQKDVAAPGCIEEEDLCGEGQGYFHKAAHWDNIASITIGGKEYSAEEAVEFITSDKKEGGTDNKGGIADSKAAFAQGVTVLLNRELGWISENAYAAELATIEAYLSTLNNLTTYNPKSLPTGNTAAKDAADAISTGLECKPAQ